MQPAQRGTVPERPAEICNTAHTSGWKAGRHRGRPHAHEFKLPHNTLGARIRNGTCELTQIGWDLYLEVRLLTILETPRGKRKHTYTLTQVNVFVQDLPKGRGRGGAICVRSRGGVISRSKPSTSIGQLQSTRNGFNK